MITPTDRELVDMKTLYRGGEHEVRCDGKSHWLIVFGEKTLRDSRCTCKEVVDAR